ncbi:MAG: GTPase [Sulfolobales archaeon]|nr:50S ribosome-binding GTPase [Sulfolobales archaeon]MCX8209012.1 50S ribosome-binding GTPase [Sulfolobales archaeon]MDW8010016.1 GTPase [Sulfolobales archaeon]
MTAALVIARTEDLAEALELARVLHSRVEVVELPDRYRASTSAYLTPKWLRIIREKVGDGNYDKVYIYDTLSPRHVSHLMKELKVVVEDRVLLILGVLAEHAGSKEAKIQIEMARLRHQIPLLRDWINRVKIGELPGFLGPGGYAIDAYYSHVRRRIGRLRRELERLRRVKDYERTRRVEAGLIHVAIAGYTNAGKTTLFNSLTGESRATGPELLTTTSTKAKMVPIGGLRVVFIDTVGFIKNIPPEIVEAFYATLREISTSSAVILIMDSSDEDRGFYVKLRESLKILVNIGFVGRPLIVALNKIDLVDSGKVAKLKSLVNSEVDRGMWFYRVVEISALRGTNLDLLKKALLEVLES